MLQMQIGLTSTLVPSSSASNAMPLAIGAAVVGGVVGGWAGKKLGWLAGTIGGALTLGTLAYYHFKSQASG